MLYPLKMIQAQKIQIQDREDQDTNLQSPLIDLFIIIMIKIQ
jgi:hypothetical protein